MTSHQASPARASSETRGTSRPDVPQSIVLRHVSRHYHREADEVRALDDVSLSIPAGSFVSFMGPSGSGKSTLLNLVCGIDRPTSGQVIVAGRRLEGMTEDQLAHWRARHVGLIFQFFNLIPVLSARENVALPLLLFPLDRDERRRRAEIALRVVGLEGRADHTPSMLSGGEQQRVAIARAIVSDPDLLIADEPTGDLDAKSAEQVLGLLRTLRIEMGKTVVMVTHDPRALRFVDQAYHLDKGLLLEGVAAERARAALDLTLGRDPRGGRDFSPAEP